MSTSRGKGAVKPDIFITGVMKGGTTILHDYISTHPEISAGSQKEIHYFSLFYDKGPDWYESHFANVPEGTRTIDASPTYFDTVNTAQIPRLIHAYAEDPRVILITRDPVERAISQFIHLKVTTSAPALQDVEIDEFFAQNFDDAYRQNTTLGYYLNQVLGFSLYTRKFITYRQEFEKSQFLVLDNQSLREGPKAVMENVFEFLNVEYVNNEVFGVVKHSNGSGINHVSLETYNKLAEFLYPDYKHFCHQAGITYKEAVHNDEQSARIA